MYKYHLKYIPFILFDCEDEEKFPTNDEELNKLILPNLLNDKIGFKNVIEGNLLESYEYEYDTRDNIINLWANSDEILTNEEIIDEIEMIEPNMMGPDGWMSGDISIVSRKDAENFEYCIELYPYVCYVGIVLDNVEYEIKLHPEDWLSFKCL